MRSRLATMWARLDWVPGPVWAGIVLQPAAGRQRPRICPLADVRARFAAVGRPAAMESLRAGRVAVSRQTAVDAVLAPEPAGVAASVRLRHRLRSRAQAVAGR